MSYWDSTKGEIVRFPPTVCDSKPGWFRFDCGCCGGIEWGGETPHECRSCRGGGEVYLHLASRVLALYPGGPFCGVATDEQVTSVENLRRDTWNASPAR